MKNKLTIVPAMPMRSASVHAELENAALDYNCFDEFVADLDKILSTFNAIDAALNNGEGEGPGLDDYSVRSIVDMRLKPLKAKCDAFYDLFNRDEKHDGNRLKREIVADRLSQLLTSFPVNGPKAPENYVSVMLAEVLAFNPTIFVLEAACRHLVRASKFVPSIAEMLEALADEDELFMKRFEALEFILDMQADLRARIAEG
jgi:hypothetical protein